MKRRVESATYKKYNANSAGHYTGDCVKRAIAMAFNLDYNQVSKLLLAQAKELHADRWNINSVFDRVILDLGGSRRIVPDEPLHVSELVDMLDEDTIIIECGPKPCESGGGNHLTCSVQGQLFDSWNSSNYYVAHYYTVEGVSHEFTDITEHTYELFEEGKEMILQLSDKYIDKYQLDAEFTISKLSDHYDYKLVYICEIDAGNKLNTDFNINCVFSPTMDIETARKKMIETIKIRLYDRFYEFNKKLAAQKEGHDLFTRSGYTDKDKPHLMLLTNVERRFFNSLPGWCKPFIYSIDIQNPGEYSDSYNIMMLPILGDPKKDNVNFYGFEAGMVKDEINRYKKTLDRPGYDYDPFEEYY